METTNGAGGSAAPGVGASLEFKRQDGPVPTAGRVVRAGVFPAALIPLGSAASIGGLMSIGVVEVGAVSVGLFVLPWWFLSIGLQLFVRAPRPAFALVQSRQEAAAARRAALSQGLPPREKDRATGAGVLSCEDLEMATLLTGVLVATVVLMALWWSTLSWSFLGLLALLCTVYAVRSRWAWQYLSIAHRKGS